MTSTSDAPVRKCFECGSDLILIETKVDVLESSYSQQTTSTYRCSNEDCQKRKDKSEMQRIQQQKERAAATAERELARQAARKKPMME